MFYYYEGVNIFLDINKHQQWLVKFYEKEIGLIHLKIRVNYITEELGELSRAVRTIEVGRDHLAKNPKSS